MFKEFTFGIITYNSSPTIVELLESIKYQIINYGEDIDFYVVLADDCSTDNTIWIAKRWIRDNQQLFKDVKIIESERNKGLCYNFSQMMNAIKTEYFVEIAGDDLISSQNIFSMLDNLGNDEIRVYFTVCFNEKGLFYDKSMVAKQLYFSQQKHTNKKDLRLLETFNPYSAVSVKLKRHHYSEKGLKYIQQFKNFEDDTSFYYILRNNHRSFFSFYMSPIFLYRKNGQSLTTSVDNSNQIRFLDDLYSFRKQTFKDERHIGTKLIIGMRIWDAFLMKHRFDATKSMYRKVRKCWDNVIQRRGYKNDSYLHYRSQMELFIQTENCYLNEIRERCRLFECTLKQNQEKE